MIIEEYIDGGLVRHYSDSGMLMRQIETGVLYGEAVDIPNRYTYEETDIPIEGDEEETEPSEAEEILDILLGDAE